METLSPRQNDALPDTGDALPGDTEFFNLAFPLPYRVAALLTFGVVLWGLNLQGLERLKIDVPALIKYPRRTTHAQAPPWFSAYRFATLLALPQAASLLLFWLLTRFSEPRVLRFENLGNVTLVLVLLALVLPGIHRIAPSGRARFSAALRRVAVGGIATPEHGKFGDVILADALTSYSKVLGDLFIVACMMVRWPHPTARPIRDCGGVVAVPLLMALPFLIRFSQCVIEFRRVQSGEYGVGHGHGRVHLMNAAKYATAFPVFICSALMKAEEGSRGGWGSSLWPWAAFINSMYSFYWDVAKDWDLELFSLDPSKRNNPNYPYGLRDRRVFHAPSVYYVVICIDFFLRITWSMKLSPHLLDYVDMEGTIFVLELAEVARRWMWIYFRIETEWVREEKKRLSTEGLSLDGLPLVGAASRSVSPYQDD